MFQSADSIHCKLGLLIYSTLLQNTQRDTGGCNQPHTHTHTLAQTMQQGWLCVHFCFFPTVHKVINSHTPDGEMSTWNTFICISSKKAAWLLVMPATHQCLHKIHFSRGGPETLLNTGPILLSTVRQSHDKSSWLNRASLAASQWTGINWIKSGRVCVGRIMSLCCF